MCHKVINVLFILILCCNCSNEKPKSFAYEILDDNMHRTIMLLRHKQFEKASTFLEKSKQNELFYSCLSWELKFDKYGENDSILHKLNLKREKKHLLDSIIYQQHLGKYYSSINKQKLSFSNYFKALQNSKKLSDSLLICKSLHNILLLMTKNDSLWNLSKQSISEYKKFAFNDFENSYAEYFNQYFKTVITRKFNLDNFNNGLNYTKKSNIDIQSIVYYQFIGVGYNALKKEPDSAKKYYNKALKLIDKNSKHYYLLNKKKGILNNLGIIEYQKKNYEEALSYFSKASVINVDNNVLEADQIINDWLSKTYEKKGDYYKALVFHKTKDSIELRINKLTYTSKINEIQEKYNIKEKENENLILKQNRNTLIVMLLVAGLLLAISYFAYRNLLSKKKLTQKEKDLQKQKIEKLLRDHELSSIDAMIEGQEKERQQIANDLHDNLGSLLATLKLHFENFKIKKNRIKEEESMLIRKADELIEEAYQKVRSIAHIKNVGVHAKEGLLPAVKNFATKVSSSNQLVIEVIDHGMDQRLENSLEVTIFRIIQELITNIIKHSKASESTIHLTHHENSVNIMVEDNGIGFKVSNITPKEGMGLYSIQKRIENLDGNVTIDSILQNGTTVIIDIPIS